MIQSATLPRQKLRVFCLEDNPLIVFHLEQMIEDLGYVFAGSLESFVDLQQKLSIIAMDCALVDIDLADGPSGPLAVKWLSERGIPCVFVTGQKESGKFAESAIGVVAKPVTEASLAAALRMLTAATTRR